MNSRGRHLEIKGVTAAASPAAATCVMVIATHYRYTAAAVWLTKLRYF